MNRITLAGGVLIGAAASCTAVLGLGGDKSFDGSGGASSAAQSSAASAEKTATSTGGASSSSKASSGGAHVDGGGFGEPCDDHQGTCISVPVDAFVPGSIAYGSDACGKGCAGASSTLGFEFRVQDTSSYCNCQCTIETGACDDVMLDLYADSACTKSLNMSIGSDCKVIPASGTYYELAPMKVPCSPTLSNTQLSQPEGYVYASTLASDDCPAGSKCWPNSLGPLPKCIVVEQDDAPCPPEYPDKYRLSASMFVDNRTCACKCDGETLTACQPKIELSDSLECTSISSTTPAKDGCALLGDAGDAVLTVTETGGTCVANPIIGGGSIDGGVDPWTICCP